MTRSRLSGFLLVWCALLASSLWAEPTGDTFSAMDVFELEWASDPQISPDGKHIAYVRNGMDIMTDKRRAQVWLIDVDSGQQQALAAKGSRAPCWSPSGDRLLFTAATEHGAQLMVHWLDSGRTAQLTRVQRAPNAVVWSPKGDAIAFTMDVAIRSEPMVPMPPKPKGAKWAPPAKVIDRMLYRRDGVGYLEATFSQVFVLPADGGTPRQLTSGNFHHRSPTWSADGESIVLSANRRADYLKEPNDSEVYALSVATGELRQLTERHGRDQEPVVSPDGKWIAYLGNDERYQGYQVTHLYLMGSDGGDQRVLTAEYDRDIETPMWSADSQSIYFSTSDLGNGKVGRVDLNGKVSILASDLGGTSLGRPYSSGTFSVSDKGTIAYTHNRPERPADIALVIPAAGTSKTEAEPKLLTRLNEDLLGHKEMAAVEEIWFDSSYDGRPVQGWIAKPPGFDPKRKYPLILEIHGGPFSDYGDRWSAEVQLFAAAGYVVLYTNPRGSTSYGAEFGNLIHHAYPGNDYDDLISGVDAVLAQGYVDEDRLYVTGGSGGGVLTAWVVGKTNRFRAAVSAKPVINWYSFALTADMYNVFYRYWFPGPPWEHMEEYMRRSPLSLVGNVETPTMLLTGEEDWRTPISESEQLYQALKLRGVDTVMVRIPEASHGIADRPSQLIAKVAHILAWFGRYSS